MVYDLLAAAHVAGLVISPAGLAVSPSSNDVRRCCSRPAAVDTVVGPVLLSAMMTDDVEWLDAICAAPELDDPRLAYAGWLEQRGDPRGEFIRASCSPGGEKRSRELLALHGERWTSVLGELVLEMSHPPRFERGFIAELYLMGTFAELVLDCAAAIVALRPVPVAVIMGAERILLRADCCLYAWQARADNAIVVGTLPDQRLLAQAPSSPETVEMLGFVGDSLRYRAGGKRCDLRFVHAPPAETPDLD